MLIKDFLNLDTKNTQNFNNANIDIFITTARGLEAALQDEAVEILTQLNIPYKISDDDIIGGLRIRSNFFAIYALNLGLTTASRVLWILSEFPAHTPEELYREVNYFPWNNVFLPDKTFAVHATCTDSFANNNMAVALKVKDAIVDKFRTIYDHRPNVDTRNPSVEIHARLFRNYVTLSVDTSGEALSNHGFRRETTAAPLRENLASALLHYSGWWHLCKIIRDREEPQFLCSSNTTTEESASLKKVLLMPVLFDPMCGSGTIGIEAALALLNKKPNVRRNNFSIYNINPLSQDHMLVEFEKIRTKIIERELTHSQVMDNCLHYLSQIKISENAINVDGFKPIIMRDVSIGCVKASQINVEAARVQELCSIDNSDFFTGVTPFCAGTLIVNPPYDERLPVELPIGDFGKNIGDALKKNFKAWQAWILLGGTQSTKSVGLRATRNISLTNGAIACKFSQFILY